MEVNVYFKPMKTYENYHFTEEEFERFEKDFLRHAESKMGEPRVGSYTCQQYDLNGNLMPARKIVFRFDEIVLK